MSKTTHWTIPEALAAAYQAFGTRFGQEALASAFEALTMKPEATRLENRRLRRTLDQYIGHAINVQGREQVTWLSNALADPSQAPLLLHAGVRWWMARDDLLRKSPGTLVPKQYMEGLKDHVSLQLLAQMLYRGAAPDTDDS